jgi:hypothetical protein
MLPAFSKSLVVILAMLQLFAPLVHAHVGNNNFNQGLHIPGLELYLTTQDTPVIQAVNVNWDSEGLLVMVDAGIKQSPDIFVEDTAHGFALTPSDQSQLSALPNTDSNFSPQLKSLSTQRPHSQNLTRAPPAQ